VPTYCNAAGTACLTPEPACPPRGCPQGQVCGKAPNGCEYFLGGSRSAGSQTCTASRLIHTHNQSTNLLSKTGGGYLDCGACPNGQSCSLDSTQCVDECIPKPLCDRDHICGTLPNGCDGEVLCGVCVDGWTCNADGSACRRDNTTCTTLRESPCTGKVCGAAADGCGELAAAFTPPASLLV
jgi:hypothetical protein